MSGSAPVVVMGVSGSGKSTVGVTLARRLRVPFVDADTLHPPANIAKMAAGTPLGDDDRRPWLDEVGEWLAAHRDGGVAACSALKRAYRDRLRAHCPDVAFLHLSGSAALLGPGWRPGPATSCRPRCCSRSWTPWSRWAPTRRG
ncbi:carbohydrate kinase, thermoresistant glucokinase family protein [Mycobacterium avium subsp. avium 2285 (R)]|nr:carbohydrate kinase, thermoresistant glucokinase family protein [Mycobacterium avium subsp. avium 2285 (R)]